MLQKLCEIHDRLARETADFDNHLTKPGFLENCIYIIDSGWKADFDNIKSLEPFMVTADPIENLFIRRYLLKRLLQAHQNKLLQYFDAEWFKAAEKNLTHEYVQYTRDNWSDIICKLEPGVAMFGFLFYKTVFAQPGTRSYLPIILISAYAALAMHEILPGGAFFIRDNFLRTPAERQAEQRKLSLYTVMKEPHTRAPVQRLFWFEGDAQNPIMPQTLLEKVAEVHQQLSNTTALFNIYKGTPGFIENCFDLAENGWKPKFINIAGLVPFEATDEFENFLKRLYLLKLLSELNINIDRCAAITKNLLEQLEQHIQKQYRALRYKNHTIRTEADMDSLHQQGITQLNHWQPTLPLAATAFILDLLIKNTHRNPVAYAFLTAFTATGAVAGFMHLGRQSYLGTQALFFADQTRQRLTQYGTALLDHAEFTSKFLCNNTQPSQRAASHRTTSEYEELLLASKNGTQALLGGFGCMLLSGIFLNGPRSVTFWLGAFLIALSVLYYHNPNRYER